MRRTADRSHRRVASDTALTIAGIVGFGCLINLVLVFGFNFSLIFFKSGSMSPTMPTGSFALVREIPASEIRVGDVLTVNRVGILPITHRVTSVRAVRAGDPGVAAVAGGAGGTGVAGDSVAPTAEGAVAAAPATHPTGTSTIAVDDIAGERVITMKGDANEVEDAAPYTVGRVRVVLAPIPTVAQIGLWIASPMVLAALALLLTAAGAWVFWQRMSTRRTSRRAAGGPARDAEPLTTAVDPPSTPEPASIPSARHSKPHATNRR